jgi:hypothetical protein
VITPPIPLVLRHLTPPQPQPSAPCSIPAVAPLFFFSELLFFFSFLRIPLTVHGLSCLLFSYASYHSRRRRNRVPPNRQITLFYFPSNCCLFHHVLSTSRHVAMQIFWPIQRTRPRYSINMFVLLPHHDTSRTYARTTFDVFPFILFIVHSFRRCRTFRD